MDLISYLVVGKPGYFGNGSDGDRKLVNEILVLNRDMHFNNLTLVGNSKIVSKGYVVYIKGVYDLSKCTVDKNMEDVE